MARTYDVFHKLSTHWAEWSRDEYTTPDIGVVTTQSGFVFVKRESYRGFKGTTLQIIINGRLRQRYFNECYSRRYCITLAHRFVEEITQYKAE